MNARLMTNSYQEMPWVWCLAPHTAKRITAEPHARWLHVVEGEVWLTQSGAGPASEDVWLAAGQSHPLPAGSEWVAEGWPKALIELLEAPASYHQM